MDLPKYCRILFAHRFAPFRDQRMAHIIRICPTPEKSFPQPPIMSAHANISRRHRTYRAVKLAGGFNPPVAAAAAEQVIVEPRLAGSCGKRPVPICREISASSLPDLAAPAASGFRLPASTGSEYSIISIISISSIGQYWSVLEGGTTDNEQQLFGLLGQGCQDCQVREARMPSSES